MSRTTPPESIHDVLAVNFFEAVDLFESYGVYINHEEICSPSRDSHLVFHRALVVFFLRKRGFSLTQIGYFINRDHATILHLLGYAERKQGRDSRYETIIKEMGPFITSDKGEWPLESKIAFFEEKLRLLYLERDIVKAQHGKN